MLHGPWSMPPTRSCPALARAATPMRAQQTPPAASTTDKRSISAPHAHLLRRRDCMARLTRVQETSDGRVLLPLQHPPPPPHIAPLVFRPDPSVTLSFSLCEFDDAMSVTSQFLPPSKPPQNRPPRMWPEAWQRQQSDSRLSSCPAVHHRMGGVLSPLRVQRVIRRWWTG